MERWMTLRDSLHHWYHRAILDSWRDRFAFLQRHGLQVVRATYDSPVPDTRLLQDGRWRQRSQMVGVDLLGRRAVGVFSAISAPLGGQNTLSFR